MSRVPVGPSVQERYLPGNACFGCGQDNPVGIQLASYLVDGVLVASWTPDERFCGPPGVVNGGVVAVPMDCHATWAAALALSADPEAALVAVVTARYEVRLRRPTPVGATVELRAEVGAVDGRRVQVSVTSRVDGATTATFDGTFVAVEGAW